MKNIFIALLINFFLFGFLFSQEKYQVIGYLPSWVNWEVSDIQVDKLSTVKYSFLEIKNNRVTFGRDSPKYTFLENLHKLLQLKQKKPNLQLIISIGGWGIDGFSVVAKNRYNRKIFAKSVARFLEKYNFDGVDIDWEFPVTGAGGVIKSSSKDRENFVLLIEEIRNQLNILEQRYGRVYSISVAVGVGPSVYKSIDFKSMELNVDYFGVMSYNLSGVWSKQTTSHVALYKDENQWAVDDGLSLILSSKINPHMIVLGIAFYGRLMGKVQGDSNIGLYQKFQGNDGKNSVTYKYIKKNYLKDNNFKVFFDKKMKATYAYNKKERLFVSYHDPKSIKEYINYMKKKNLGGVFIWEITQDDDEKTLLKSINKYMK